VPNHDGYGMPSGMNMWCIAIYIVGRRKMIEMRRRARIARISFSAVSSADVAAGDALCAPGADFTLAP
jgi:hypothetical protein